MYDKKDAARDNSEQLIALLNEILSVEYSMMNHCPRIARALRDEESREIMDALGIESNKHGDIIAGIIQEVGGKPD